MAYTQEVKEEFASLAKDTGKREELAELFVEYTQPGHITTDFVSLLLDTKNLNLGDAIVKKVRKGIKVHTFVPGAIPLKSEITVSERMNYILDGSIVSVTANEWELESGELGTVADISNEMALKVKDYHMNKVFTALTTIWTAVNTANNYVSVGGNVTKTVLDAAINRINQTTPGVKAIAGTRVALTPILSFAGFYNGTPASTNTTLMEGVAEEIFRTGWLGQYLGVPIVVINQDYDALDTYNKLIPEDKILVIGEKVGTFITYGPVRSQQYTDMKPVPPQWNLSIYQQFGFIIDNAQGIYVIGNLS
jgi:hypothetical protein